MTNQQGAPEALRTITRYEVVDCIDSKHVPAVIPNKDGPWVRYEDHIAALVEAQQPAPSAAGAPKVPSYTIDDMRQAPAGAAEEVDKALNDYAQAFTARAMGWTREHGDAMPDARTKLYSAISSYARGLSTTSPTPQADSQPAPIDMVLFCPACGTQHIDASEPPVEFEPGAAQWNNPPHRSHLCHGCGHIWRPADVPTNGVKAVKTTGKADSPIAARAPADSVTAPAGGVDDDVNAVALARYKVVPAHESMFHRFAVVAGDGKQQLYLGREIECANMAHKFAGAFLDGVFYQSNIAPTPP
ncbi:hypothetical protein DBR23_05880, partial [Acidovorax sp. HMWF018]